ncbi:MAG: hypothetical protein R3E79_13700 [Caldilineaceae bacterium]
MVTPSRKGWSPICTRRQRRDPFREGWPSRAHSDLRLDETYVNTADNHLVGDDRRVVRGGSFGYSQGGVRCAARYYFDIWLFSVGVRVAWSPGS